MAPKTLHYFFIIFMKTIYILFVNFMNFEKYTDKQTGNPTYIPNNAPPNKLKKKVP